MFTKKFFHIFLFLGLLPSLLFSSSPTPKLSSTSGKNTSCLLHLLKRCLPETSRDKKERYYLFLKHVTHALKRPEIWNNLQNLLLILMQFEQFAEQAAGYRYYEQILAQVIEKRIHFLLSEQQVSELTNIFSPPIGDS
ncbi:hypothetical protein C6H88_04340 [Chlamydia muridarum str. Nigg]|uniref:Uncharacterized protein n=2 Tax=Chlamydia muridarum TaxID=83560 RepID=A0A070A4Y3_CHLMR|nr:hypothetical protein [Chlamydia muridarum]AAF39640.1 hypothetical protein TC_0840 [Chlamydia muridarum str. Nigg]AHH23227.1 hypothetical protein TAC_04450 [Chlamydia muridarum str. Nigg3 CMUT3-5]AHH24153.1 hypothetical protein Y015_04450 [Chlamydia muridarum str. Nigg CM972]AID38353.1 hypothetical protein BB17_04505 [Chlamydia muridarum str. Nigg 2 MCR]AIT90989.1 hypothetical protein NC80_04245 [Chlamydia muridarum]